MLPLGCGGTEADGSSFVPNWFSRSMHGRLRPSISLRNSSFLGQDRVAPAPLAAPGLLLAALPLRSKLTVQTGFVHPSRLLAAGPTERQFQAFLDHAELLGVTGQRPPRLLCVCGLDES